MRAPSNTFAGAKSLRRKMTLPEVILWQHLRGKGIVGLRFRRQHPIGPYVLDFYCPSARLCIEVDGRAAHDNPQQAGNDARRDDWLAGRQIAVLRFPAADILNPERLENVLATIWDRAAPSTAVPAVPLPRLAEEDKE